jgi:hypothetical protein
MFDNIYKKLELQLNEKKSQMALIIEDSNSSYEARYGLLFSVFVCCALGWLFLSEILLLL